MGEIDETIIKKVNLYYGSSLLYSVCDRVDETC
jgi:hypothetical protein